MKKLNISDELLGAYLDGQVDDHQQRHITEQLTQDSELRARLLALQALQQQLKAAGTHLLWANASAPLKRTEPPKPIGAFFAKIGQSFNLSGFALLASLVLTTLLGVLLGSTLNRPSEQNALSGTWIYRATQAHQLAQVQAAWQPIQALDEIPSDYQFFVQAYQGEAALHQLGYQLVGWRLASDSHSPVALQLAYQHTNQSLATAFIRHHVENEPQSSQSIVLNGFPAFFTGQNNIDTALVGSHLPFDNPAWQRLARLPARQS